MLLSLFFLRVLLLFASLPQRFVYASPPECPPVNADDYITCPDDGCNCTKTRKLEGDSAANSIRGVNDNDGRALQDEDEKSDGKGWGWHGCKYLFAKKILKRQVGLSIISFPLYIIICRLESLL